MCSKVIDALNNFSHEKHFATVGTPVRDNDRRTFPVKDVNGKTVNFNYTHAYSVESVNAAAKTVTVVNPHDTSKPITLSYAEFLTTFASIDFVSINYHGLIK